MSDAACAANRGELAVNKLCCSPIAAAAGEMLLLLGTAGAGCLSRAAIRFKYEDKYGDGVIVWIFCDCIIVG